MTTESEREPQRERPKLHLSNIRGGNDYLDVAQRIVWFRSEYPHGRIETVAHELTTEGAIFKATVEDGEGGMATGWGSETPRDFGEFIEKAETKAVGRALGAMGYGT